MIEALCTRCEETFVIHDAEDPIDFIHADCGGIGVIQGEWIAPSSMNLDNSIEGMVNLTAQEAHGVKMPNCDDPDCEFHHPKVREY